MTALPRSIRFVLLIGWLSVVACGMAEPPTLLLRLPSVTDLDGLPGAERPGWVPLLSFSFANSRPGGLGGGSGSLPPSSFSDIRLSKYLDATSPRLWVLANKGTIFSNAVVEFTRTAGGQVYQYQLELKKVVASSCFQSAASGDEQMQEDVFLYFGSLTASLREVDPDASTAEESLYWWDQLANKGGTSLPGIDTDLDGIPDNYEVTHALNRLADDADEDLDGDGMSNLAEYLAGTSANDPSSVLRVTRVLPGAGNTLRVFWSAVSGRSYDVMVSDRPEGPFKDIHTVLAGSTGEISDLVSRPPGSATFVRVRVLQ